MSEFRQKIKKLFPPAVWKPISAARYAAQRWVQYPAAYIHPWRQESMLRLAALKDMYRGERCFVVLNRFP